MKVHPLGSGMDDVLWEIIPICYKCRTPVDPVDIYNIWCGTCRMKLDKTEIKEVVTYYVKIRC